MSVSSETSDNDLDDHIIEKLSVLGEGAYGKVYDANAIIQGEVRECAVKTNFCDSKISGTNVLRDINFHFLLNHPNIIKINYLFEGDPFQYTKTPMTPLAKGISRNHRQDRYNFVFDKVGKDVCGVMEDSEFDFNYIDKLICYTLLAVEFCHANSVLHRDIKLENILYEHKDDEIKVCLTDFGLSCAPTKYRPMTPGVCTPYYRAPEICAYHKDYSYASDIWSLGSAFYECVADDYYPGCGLTTRDSSAEENKKLLKCEIKKMPRKLPKEELSAFLKKGGMNGENQKKFLKNVKTYGNFDVKADLTKKLGECDFEIDKFDELCDLISKMLDFEPSKRPTATECLEHPYLSHLKDIIDKTRKDYPPIKKIRKIAIYDIVERKWACNILVEIFNDHMNKVEDDWCHMRILFHSLRIFDKYIEFLLEDDNTEKGTKEVEGSGRLMTYGRTEFVLWCIMYICHKFFTVLGSYMSWEDFYKFGAEKYNPKINKNDKVKKMQNTEKSRVNKLIRDFDEVERIVIYNVLEYRIFEDTVLEYMDHDYDDEITREDIEMNKKEAFRRYCSVKEFKGTSRELYEKIILNDE